MSSLDYLDLCRLCLVKERVSVPIFEGEGDVRQIFLKIAACLPVKVAREDKLPKKICDDCVYKVELFYQFWNTTANAEKQLLQWLGDVGLEDKQDYVANVLNPSVMKQEQSGENRLDGSVMQQVSGHQNNMGMGMMENISLGMPMLMSAANQQQMTSVPMDTSSTVNVQEIPGTSTQAVHDQMPQNQTSNSTQAEEEEESSEEEENSDDECDGDEGLPVKEESEEDPNNSRAIEPTTFVNVSLACDEAGPSGLQQQKITEIPEMTLPQTADGDPKTGEGEFGRRIPKIEDISRPVQIVDKGLPAAHPLQRAYPEVKSQYSLTPMVGESCKSDYLMTVSSCVKLETDNSQEEALRKNAIKYHACNKCSMKFPLETMLHRHKMTHDLRRIVLKARHQGRSSFHQFHPRRTSNIVLQKHRKNHQNHEYNCTLCDFRSSKKIILSAHTKTMHQIRVVKSNLEKAAAYGNNVECSVQVKKRKKVASKKIKHSNDAYCTCKHCDVQFKSSNALAAHASQCHPKSSRNTGRDEDCDSGQCNNYRSSKREKPQIQFYGNEMQQPSTTTFSCSGCKFQCKKRSTMTTHVAKKHIKNNLEEHCNLCDFKCSKKSTLYSHKRRHKLEANNEVYSCSECDFKTSKRTSLYSHIKRKHKIAKSCTGDDKPVFFYCTQCDYKNKNKYELKVHVARKHTDDFKFSCETCGKKFKVKGDLTNHIRFSHREQPVICDVCGKTCMNSNSLYVHQKFAHYKAKYECQICKRRMVTQENLNEHMLRQHEKRENVVCEECGKTFSRNSRLKVHMRIHTGDKPYTCTICKKAFARRTALKQHLLIHTGIRPYVCDICGKAFTQKPGLISHRKSHPGSHPPLPRVLIDHILNDVMKN